MAVSTCRSCGAEIFFAATENGRQMPIDVRAEKRVVIERRGNGLPPLARVVDTYVSHFSSCPSASEHRKARTPAPAGSPGPTPKAR
jgi:hypothetical protein